MKRGSFAVGFLTCLLLAGVTTTAYATGILAERSTNRVFVDGQEVQIEAYAIHDNNFMQLRDIGKAVGFNVYWNAEDGSVQIETDKPYTGEAPIPTSAVKTITLPTDGSQYVPSVGDVIRCDDGQRLRHHRCEPLGREPVCVRLCRRAANGGLRLEQVPRYRAARP